MHKLQVLPSSPCNNNNNNNLYSTTYTNTRHASMPHATAGVWMGPAAGSGVGTTRTERSRSKPPTPPFDLSAADASTTVELCPEVRMPIIGLGGGIFSSNAAEAMATAMAMGYRLIDTAPKYSTESALANAIAASGVPRASLFIATKVCNGGYDAALRSVERSLAALGTDYVDLLLMHSAVHGGAKKDPRSSRHAEARRQTWRAMRELQAQGRVRACGVCNFSLRQLRQLQGAPNLLQLEFQPLLQRWDLLRYCRDHGIVVQAYGSGGGGWRLWRKHPELELVGRPPLRAAAAAHDKSAHQVSLRWALQHGLCVIPKAAQEEHQRENLQLFDFSLSEQEMAAIDALSTNRSVYKFRDPDVFS